MVPFRELSIRRQMIQVILAICTLVLLLAAVGIGVYELLDYRRSLIRSTTVLADVVANNVSAAIAFGDQSTAMTTLRALHSEEHVIGAALYDGKHHLFVQYSRPDVKFAFPSTPGADRARFQGGGLAVIRPVEQAGRRLGTIYIEADTEGISDRLLVFGAITTGILVVALLVAVALTRWLQKPITRPIVELTETARMIADRRDFSVRAPRHTGGEIGTLTAAFNEMLAVIEERRAALVAANDQLKAEVEERQAAEARTHAQVARLAQLNFITRAIAERQDVESVFQTVIVSLEEQLPVDFACVCLYDAERSLLRVASVGRRSIAFAGAVGLDSGTEVAIDQNGLSRCVRGELVYEPDTADVAMPFPRRMSGAGFHSLVAAPLLVESRVFGVLLAARHAADAFSSGECEFLRQLSEHVALAAHQTQLYNALQRAYDDLRETQQAMMQQERLRALGQMASGIAHDINNAISPVSLYIESMLEKEPHLTETGRERLIVVQRAIEDVAHTVSRMREFYRQRSAEVATVKFELNQLIEQVIDLTKARWFDMPQNRGAVIELKRDFAAEPPLITGVESEIREALTNLVFNAVDALPQGGVITLRTSTTERPNEASEKPERLAVIEVSDTGTGMTEETLKRCMEPFFTTKGERGTGLGLAMVYGIVKRHRGDIEMESRVGQGTTVRLLFPAAAGHEPLIERPPAAPTVRFRILLIDDDPLLLKSVGDVLTSDGHAVTTAGGGQAGINAFEHSQAGHVTFDAVITDLGMPYVDGRRVAAAIKRLSPQTPVFLLTGWGNRMAADGDVPPDVDRILSKPPKLREIREALATVVPPSS